jgi:hypothetical protein
MVMQAVPECAIVCAVKALGRLKVNSRAGWRLRLPMANDEWQMANGEWRMASQVLCCEGGMRLIDRDPNPRAGPLTVVAMRPPSQLSQSLRRSVGRRSRRCPRHQPGGGRGSPWCCSAGLCRNASCPQWALDRARSPHGLDPPLPTRRPRRVGCGTALAGPFLTLSARGSLSVASLRPRQARAIVTEDEARA